MPHPILPIRSSTPSPQLTKPKQPGPDSHSASTGAQVNGHSPSLSNELVQSHTYGDTMKAVVWEGRVRHMSVRHVPKPRIQGDSQLLVRITTAASERRLPSHALMVG